MKISVISVFPQIHEPFIQHSLIKRAIDQKLIEINLVSFSQYCAPKERIDEPTCGPGAGMILKPTVVQDAIDDCEKRWGPGYKIFFSPQGTKLSQPVLEQLAAELFLATPPMRPYPFERTAASHLILVCSRYEGMDARVEQHCADAIISVGDYVLMGGDIPAQILLEGLLRLFPAIVGNQESVEHDSFSGPFLDHPEYGLPLEWNGMQVPDIVRSGNHAAIAAWRKKEACKKTMLKRFDWFSFARPSQDDIQLAQSCIPVHYVALMHTEVNLKDGTVGNTSITSIDLHDTARSCVTYGIKNFFMVSPLHDQQAIMATFLKFWHSPTGQEYNASRYDAVSRVRSVFSLDDVIAQITELEGQAPLLIATSAKTHEHGQKIDYQDKEQVWQSGRPVLFLFGTGQGLAEHIITRCDFLLPPVRGLTTYNHLSVRSAIAIILDRWLGLQR